VHFIEELKVILTDNISPADVVEHTSCYRPGTLVPRVASLLSSRE